MIDSKCKICRRSGLKLFLKGERCFSQKCAMIKKAYPPGPRRKRRTKALSEYGKELREKQKLKNWYNLEEKHFQKYVKKALQEQSKEKDAGTILINLLESRLDNVIFRLGISPSRNAARQIVSHGHLLVNDKPVNIPSYSVKKGDEIKVKPNSIKKTNFQKLLPLLKKQNPPSWLSFNAEKMEAKITGSPNPEEAALPADLLSIFEFYSR